MSETRLHSLSIGAFQSRGGAKTASAFHATRLLWAGWVLVILLGGFSLNLWRLDAESIWHDEGWSIRAMRGPFTTPDDNTPYLYYTYLHVLWRLGIGETPFAMRYGSVLLGLLTTAMAMRVAGQWFGRSAGLTGGILVAASPLLWEYAQEIRAYVAVPLVGLVLLWAIDRVLKIRPTQTIPISVWLRVWLAEIIGLYTHNLVVPLVVWLNVAVGVVWLWRRDWRHMVIWAGLQSLLIIAYVPWLLTQAPSGTPLNSPPEIGFTLVRDIWHSYFLPSLPQLRGTDDKLWLDLAGLVAIALGVTCVILQRTYRTWLLISQAVLVPIFSTALILRAHIDFHPRYYIAAVPAALLIMVAGMTTIAKSDHKATLVGYAVLITGAISLTSVSLNKIADNRIYQHDDFAALARYYATLPNDAIILIPFKREPALQDYYAEKLGIQARFINIPLYSDADAVIRRLQPLATGRHIEFLTWFQLPADVRGMYPCLLGASSSGVTPPQTYFGLETIGYQLDKFADFQPLAANPRYHEIELQGARWMASSNGAVCVETTWQLSTTTNDDWQTAVSILNPLDTVITYHDAPIARRDQTPTSEWGRSDKGTAYNLLHLPEGAPPIEYPLEMTVYSVGQPSGLDLLSAEGGPIGKAYRFDERLPLPGQPFDVDTAGSLVETNNTTGILDGSVPLDVTVRIYGPDITPNADGMVNIYLRGMENGLYSPIVWELHTLAPYGYLSWHRFEIPSDAPNGQAYLWVEESYWRRFEVIKLVHTFEPPSFSTPVQVEFPNIGTLVGVTVPQNEFSADALPQISLIWQASQATEKSYTVFVQLLDPNGVLLAQSDREPAGFSRPTTGWVTGEYITDNHSLNFRVDEYVENYSGLAYFIVGLYDPVTFERVPLEDGQNFIRLPLEITIVRE